MKKKLIILIPLVFFVVLIIGVIGVSMISKPKVFSLEKRYYESGKLEEIDFEELEKLVKGKEAFGVFVYQPMCATSADFEVVLNSFIKKYNMTFYTVEFSKIKGTNVAEFLVYYPSFIIYNDGKMVDFLESDKDEDLEAYTSLDGFEKWISSYVKLGNVNENYSSTEEPSPSDSTPTTSNSNEVVPSESEKPEISINLDNIKKEKGKVNIYFFYGAGCPHCASEHAFFKELEDEGYDQYYNLYDIEVWHNAANEELAESFAKAMGDKLNGVPYTIIGNKTFSGFSDAKKNDFKKAIKAQAKKDFDVYLDKVKK